MISEILFLHVLCEAVKRFLLQGVLVRRGDSALNLREDTKDLLQL